MRDTSDYRVLVHDDDMLLFHSTADGSVMMLAVPLREWEERVSLSAWERSDKLTASVARQVFLEEWGLARTRA